MSVSAGQAESNLAWYGRAMLESLPQLLIDHCTNSGPLSFEQEDVVIISPTKQVSEPFCLSYALNHSAAPAPPTVSSDTAIPPSPSVETVIFGDAGSRHDSIHDSSRLST